MLKKSNHVLTIKLQAVAHMYKDFQTVYKVEILSLDLIVTFGQKSSKLYIRLVYYSQLYSKLLSTTTSTHDQAIIMPSSEIIPVNLLSSLILLAYQNRVNLLGVHALGKWASCLVHMCTVHVS